MYPFCMKIAEQQQGPHFSVRALPHHLSIFVDHLFDCIPANAFILPAGLHKRVFFFL